MKFSIVITALAVLMSWYAHAETALTVTEISETDVAIPYESADSENGNSAANVNGDIFFLLHNGDGANSATVTFTAQQTTKEVPGYGTLTKSNLAVALTAGQRKMVGPFRSRAWNDSSDDVILSYSGSGSAAVNVAALRVPGK